MRSSIFLALSTNFFTKSSKIVRWIKIRLAETHVCPEAMNEANSAPATLKSIG